MRTYAQIVMIKGRLNLPWSAWVRETRDRPEGNPRDFPTSGLRSHMGISPPPDMRRCGKSSTDEKQSAALTGCAFVFTDCKSGGTTMHFVHIHMIAIWIAENWEWIDRLSTVAI